ncbi:glycerophosphodiester phosphodiesterase domain-containing protein 4 [Sorex fumeus]|uniref:glycerophosphodiester phosphodiesterase domain-containing protein 4 n=1 Tax=Sorex fumeus TaxID=62283 RepID=UPI0024AD3B12|nr:glycerophosphodiester phosphodiesterase domain-containing protein 4 [Sorex fumeus]
MAQRQDEQQDITGLSRVCSRKCYLTCITGCLTCQWKVLDERRSERAICCCSWTERLFYLLLAFAWIVSLIVLYMWIESSNEYFGFDWVVFLGTGFWFYWSIFFLSLYGIMFAYTSLLLIFGLLFIWEGFELFLHWSNKVLLCLLVAFYTFLFWALFTYWEDRWLTVGLSLQVFCPFIQLTSIPLMTLLSWLLFTYLFYLEGEVKARRAERLREQRKLDKKCDALVKLRAIQISVGVPFVIILLCLYFVPIGHYSPCVKDKNTLGPKPLLIAHRGAPMLGPENTQMSFEKAVEHESFGLETDIYLSKDGIPYCMHDSTLRRTTNIRDIQPNATNQHSSNFTWEFLSTLNAGQWFINHPPFFNMELPKGADLEKARSQKIPLLADFLKIAKSKNRHVIFDLNRPPKYHPYRYLFVHKTVEVILASKIEQHLVYWLQDFNRAYVKLVAPGFHQMGRLRTIETLSRENINIINVDFKSLFANGLREYKNNNITINIYVVNTLWLFSLAWCSKINSVTTDMVHELRKINYPSYFMTTNSYMFWWFLLDFLSVIFIGAIFYFHW